MNISTTLPQKIKNEPYIPTDEDIKRLLQVAGLILRFLSNSPVMVYVVQKYAL